MSKGCQTRKILVLMFAGVITPAFATIARGEIRQADWPDPVANVVIPYQSSGLSHGPLLGRPIATSMRIWIRTVEPMEFKVVYDTQLPLTIKVTWNLEGTGEVGLKEGKWLYRDLALGPWYEYCGWANFTTGPQYQPTRWGKARIKKGSNIRYDPKAWFIFIILC